MVPVWLPHNPRPHPNPYTGEVGHLGAEVCAGFKGLSSLRTLSLPHISCLSQLHVYDKASASSTVLACCSQDLGTSVSKCCPMCSSDSGSL